MQAITYERYGGPDVLALTEAERPTAGDGEVLIHVRAASANPRDWHYMRGSPYVMRPQFGLRHPKDHRLGTDVAGEVAAVGSAVTRFRPGDAVIADVEAGGFAEYVGAAEDLVARKPANVTFEQAATVPLAGVTALQGLRDCAGVQAGQSVLIIGAGGGVGTFAVQLAVWLGAEVTGVCSTGNVERVRALGAHDVIDYTSHDLADAGRRWDVIFQLAGTRAPRACRRLLAPGGTLVASSGESAGHLLGPLPRLAATALLSPFVSQRLRPFVAKRSGDDLELLAGLIDEGVITPVVDRAYPLSATAEAIRHLEEGHARGNVVIAM